MDTPMDGSTSFSSVDGKASLIAKSTKSNSSSPMSSNSCGQSTARSQELLTSGTEVATLLRFGGSGMVTRSCSDRKPKPLLSDSAETQVLDSDQALGEPGSRAFPSFSWGVFSEGAWLLSTGRACGALGTGHGCCTTWWAANTPEWGGWCIAPSCGPDWATIGGCGWWCTTPCGACTWAMCGQADPTRLPGTKLMPAGMLTRGVPHDS
mmetsp:Transcript_33410/g.79212  ORF Transcript_33410/g.79212 Transcript_33410/m.79212 type:complete len:208 (+) Transcript_33410:367-990(+)